MPRLFNLEQWTVLEADQAFEIQSNGNQKIHCHTPEGTNWFISYDGDDLIYLATTSGEEEFTFSGELKGVKLFPDNYARVRSNSVKKVHFDATGKPTFARIAQREPRDPRVERAVMRAMENSNRLNASMIARIEEQERYMAQMEARISAASSKLDNQAASNGAASGGTPAAGKADPATPAKRAGEVSSPVSADQSNDQGGQSNDGNAGADE